MIDVIPLLSFSFAIASIGIALLIYQRQSEQGSRVEGLAINIDEYVEEQKKKESRIKTGYARGLLSLINYARMEIHGINAQIKFLKILKSKPSKRNWKSDLKEEEKRRESVTNYVRQLRDYMTKSAIATETILEIFDEPTQLLYEKMWKMFVFTEPVLVMGEDYYKSMMNFINIGVEASEELHKLMLEHIPDSQKDGYKIRSVVVS